MRTNSPDILLHEAAPHGLNHRINLCLCLHLFTESYLVADAIAKLSCPQCLNVAPSDSTHQCLVDTIPSQINVLVPGFQEPSAANYLSESISIHKINVLFNTNVWFDATMCPWVGAYSFVSTHQCCGGVNASWDARWNLGNLLLILSLIPIKEDRGTLWSLPSKVGRGTKHPKLGNILTRDWITYLLVFLSFVSHCTLVCVFSWIQLELLLRFFDIRSLNANMPNRKRRRTPKQESPVQSNGSSGPSEADHQELEARIRARTATPMPSREALVDHSEVSLIGDIQDPEHIDQGQEQVSEIVRNLLQNHDRMDSGRRYCLLTTIHEATCWEHRALSNLCGTLLALLTWWVMTWMSQRW